MVSIKAADLSNFENECVRLKAKETMHKQASSWKSCFP